MKDDIVHSPPPEKPVSDGPVRQTSLSGNVELAIQPQAPAESRKENNQQREKPADISNQQPSQESKPKNQHLVPVVLAVLVLIFLAGVAIKAGSKQSVNTASNLSPASSQPQASSETNMAAAADQKTINDQASAIDSLSNSEDTSGQGLTDQNLGL